MATIARAWVDTRHFSFEAYAANRKEAREALKAGLMHHAASHQCAADFVDEAMSDATVEAFVLGAAYRDHEIIGD